MKRPYCTQNKGDCGTCSLVNYDRDCRNNPITRQEPVYLVRSDSGTGEVQGLPTVGETATIYIDGVPYNDFVREILSVSRMVEVDDFDPNFDFLDD